MKKRSGSATVSSLPKLRPGEGTLMPVIRQNIPLPDGSNTVAGIGVDLGSAPVPDRKYVADTASIVKSVDGARMMFAQQKLGKEQGLRSLLVVHLSVEALRNFCSFIGSLEKQLIAKIDGLGPNDIPLSEISVEPDQTVAFTANIIVGGYAGGEATMDFLHSSAFVIDYMVKVGDKMAVDPIVRVSLPSRLFLNLVTEAKAIELDVLSPAGKLSKKGENK